MLCQDMLREVHQFNIDFEDEFDSLNNMTRAEHRRSEFLRQESETRLRDFMTEKNRQVSTHMLECP
jgi:hypothetical protein